MAKKINVRPHVRKVKGEIVRVKGYERKSNRSPQISYAEAKKVHQRRSLKARTMDESTTNKNLLDRPNKAWKKRPGVYDTRGIDTPKKSKKK